MEKEILQTAAIGLLHSQNDNKFYFQIIVDSEVTTNRRDQHYFVEISLEMARHLSTFINLLIESTTNTVPNDWDGILLTAADGRLIGLVQSLIKRLDDLATAWGQPRFNPSQFTHARLEALRIRHCLAPHLYPDYTLDNKSGIPVPIIPNLDTGN